MFRRLPFVIGALLIAVAIPARAQEATQNQVQDKAPATAPAAKPATDDPNYVIGPQDMVDISVWKEQELSRTVPVRPDGKISLPLVNDVQAAGLTPSQLSAQLTYSLKKFVANPQVTVIVTSINSQRIYIMGEASRPGAYPLLPGMTFLQALSSAGGFSQFANLKKIYLLRKENGNQVKFPFNYKDVIAGKHPEQNIVLKAGDTIVVP
jgi:polysaccharide export outer membrane protein